MIFCDAAGLIELGTAIQLLQLWHVVVALATRNTAGVAPFASFSCKHFAVRIAGVMNDKEGAGHVKEII
jgi:hypothetical protein